MKNKVIIITGASSGIGKALAIQLSQRGNKLMLASRNHDKLKNVVDKLNIKNKNIIGYPTNVGNAEDCLNLINHCINKFGRIDVLINNAGISMRAIFNEVNLEVIEKVMKTNFWGTVYCTKYALPYLLKSNGSLIGISSIAGHVGLPERSAYSASKFAMNGFLESIRSENMENNLHVLIACPGFTKSNIRKKALTKDGDTQNNSPRDEKNMMTAEKVAQMIIQAMVSRKDNIIISKNGKLAIWLNKLIPKLARKLIFNHFKKEKRFQ